MFVVVDMVKGGNVAEGIIVCSVFESILDIVEVVVALQYLKSFNEVKFSLWQTAWQIDL